MQDGFWILAKRNEKNFVRSILRFAVAHLVLAGKNGIEEFAVDKTEISAQPSRYKNKCDTVTGGSVLAYGSQPP